MSDLNLNKILNEPLEWERVRYSIGIDLGTCNIVAATCLLPEEGDPPFAKPMTCIALNYPAECEFSPENFPANPVDGSEPPREKVPGVHLSEIKKFLGLSPEDMRIVNGEGDYGYPLEKGHFKMKGASATPEEIVAFMAKRIANHFEASKKEVNAVCTVPAYFGETQRRATKKALELAGIHAVSLVNEPTAAAIAYSTQIAPGSRVLVVDIGGGTTDVTALEKVGTELQVRATSGDPHLGGQELDRRLVELVLGRKESEGAPDNATRLALMREAKRCRETLTTESQVTFKLSEFNGDEVDWEEMISAIEMDSAIRATCQQVTAHIDEVLSAVNWAPSKVDTLLLVGGAVRTPLLRQIIMAEVPKAKLVKNVNPEFAIAEGAALHMQSLEDIEKTGSTKADIAPVKDVLSKPMGVATIGDYFSVIVKGNTPIPWRASQYFQTSVDFQRKVTLEIFQGTASSASLNTLVGVFEMPIVPRLKGEIKIKVEFSLTSDGFLNVTATEINGNGNKRTVKINRKSEPGNIEETTCEPKKGLNL